MSAAEGTAGVADTIERFNDAFGRHDLDALGELVADDVVFEDTSPPDGNRAEGKEAVLRAWEELFRSSPRARFDAEEVIVAGDRCVVRWRYTFDHDDPDGGHVRGIDLFAVSQGRVIEKLSYVKG